jgi:hypothetical protein
VDGIVDETEDERLLVAIHQFEQLMRLQGVTCKLMN